MCAIGETDIFDLTHGWETRWIKILFDIKLKGFVNWLFAEEKAVYPTKKWELKKRELGKTNSLLIEKRTLAGSFALDI